MPTKTCPFCKEQKAEDASTCPHCGEAEIGTGTFLLALFFVSPFILCMCIVVLAAIWGI